MIKMKIKTGDSVRVMVGRDKGKTGKVTQVFPAKRLVVVDGVNNQTRHVKSRGDKPGQKVTFNAPIRVDNVTKTA